MLSAVAHLLERQPQGEVPFLELLEHIWGLHICTNLPKLLGSGMSEEEEAERRSEQEEVMIPLGEVSSLLPVWIPETGLRSAGLSRSVFTEPSLALTETS